ncbi:hypothetical protein LPB140_09535 [Sphingorhabdus lutea]|uniref:Uncharacterized protein n=1 Tax=Sphingorhabdus lutea TaxID=1913578 RepID=A0A1L3JD27_9SPHN|nr:hypothetical protein LPB140_09535 [Sphingorhabdus lutea]
MVNDNKINFLFSVTISVLIHSYWVSAASSYETTSLSLHEIFYLSPCPYPLQPSHAISHIRNMKEYFTPLLAQYPQKSMDF